MSAQQHTALPPHEQAFTLRSRRVADDFSIRVALPATYSMTEARYPVLYVLDGDHSFGLAASVLAYVNLGGNFGMGKGIPEMIVVGIGYDRGTLPWLFTRVRDFTPTEDASFNYDNPQFSIPESGRADAFLAMIREELKPELESRFRVDGSPGVLATHSLGGVLALHAMLRPEPVFGKYLLASPFVGWDSGAMFRREEEYGLGNAGLAAEAFFAVSGQEPTPPYREEVERFCAALEQRRYDRFRFELRTYDRDNHFSMWPKAFMDGLEYLFN
ncbi:alpha/beta hydrolase [Salidesulfovibrio onnuriiensis]|uniref:alpha/beta hydrolase n=1 Tax=Salidesulfovibrio onnuriiensis TaxID=2583823 RepID=UPI0011CA06C1|nr:alpha/beta hydrolase-fold protein [Salidesulfovibrio onnuriiensis]